VHLKDMGHDGMLNAALRLNIPTIFVSGGPLEALGLSLPGNGSLLATHADRQELFLQAGRTIVDITRQHYEQDDYAVLPRQIANRATFENAMTLDIAMGGSTNKILHLLAVLYGTIALNGCIVKTAGVDEKNGVLDGPAWRKCCIPPVT